jgi:hypothetical protein
VTAPTITLNCRAIGNRTRRRFDDPTPTQYIRALQLDLEDRIFNYSDKPGTVIADQLYNLASPVRNNTADHYRLTQERYPWLFTEAVPMLRAYCKSLIFKVPGGNPAPWFDLSLKTIHQMIAPWEDVLDLDCDALILDGMANGGNFSRVRMATSGNIKLGTSVWPGWRDDEYDRNHPARLQLTTLHNLASVANRMGSRGRSFGGWWGEGRRDDVEQIVWLTGHGGGDRSLMPEVEHYADPAFSVYTHSDHDHRLVAEYLEARV